MSLLAHRYRLAVATAQDGEPALLPAVLSRACVAVLPVEGAGLSLVEQLRVPLGASDPLVERAERLQTTLGEGPCLSAVQAGEPVLLDAAGMADRWPVFHRELLRQTPFRSVASLPLRSGAEAPFGALDLYSTASDLDPLLVQEHVRADVADQISAYLLAAPMTTASWTEERVAAWLAGRSVAERMEVWRAAGMLMRDAGLSQTDSVALLRANAFRRDVSLDEVAALMTSGQLSVADLAG